MRNDDGRRTQWFSIWTPPSGHKHGRGGRRSGANSKVRGTKGMDRDRDAVTAAVAAAAIRGHRGYVLASARATVPTQTPRTTDTERKRAARNSRFGEGERGNRRRELKEKKIKDQNARRNANGTRGTFCENG